MNEEKKMGIAFFTDDFKLPICVTYIYQPSQSGSLRCLPFHCNDYDVLFNSCNVEDGFLSSFVYRSHNVYCRHLGPGHLLN